MVYRLLIIGVGCLVSVGSAVWADPPAKAGIGSYASSGSGCPQGSAWVFPGPDRTEISVLIRDYAVILDDRGGAVAASNCNIDIPILVPEGWTVGLWGIDYRGFAVLPEGSEGSFTRQYVFAGTTGVKENVQFEQSDLFFFVVEDDVPLAFSRPKEAVVIARIHTRLQVKRKRSSPPQTSVVSLFSADQFFAGGYAIRLYLEWKPVK